jgi:nitric oxide synthase oxygenase domain/subunit
VDPYSATDSFIQHHKTEIKDRGFIAGDWVWLVPPAAGGMSELFHLEMINAYLTPNFKARMMSLADLMKRSGLIILP